MCVKERVGLPARGLVDVEYGNWALARLPGAYKKAGNQTNSEILF